MWWRSVGLKALYDQWRATLGLGLFMAAYAGFIMLIYPSIAAISEIRDIFERLPEAFRVMFAPGGIDITTPEGYLAAEFFSIIGPLMFFGYAIAIGGSATAGEEERGTIEILASLPVPRSRIVLEKFAGLLIGTAILGVFVLAGIALGGLAAGEELRLDGLAAIISAAVLLAYQFGALAMLIGALTGRRFLAIGLALAAAIASYFVYSFSALVEALKPARALSPFTYYIGDNPLVHGLQPEDVAVLVGTTVILVALALVSFRRRDLRV